MGFRNKIHEIEPDEIFLDSKNLPSFETERLEGRIEYALSKRAVVYLGLVFILVGLVFVGRAFSLEVLRGDQFALRASENHLRETVLLAERGTIKDVKGVPLAWNGSEGKRAYIPDPGFGHLLGFVGLPGPDDSGFPPQERLGKAGVEKTFNDYLRGTSGLKIQEVNAKNEVISEHERLPASSGRELSLTIDEKVQKTLYKAIVNLTEERGFRGGAGMIMDVHSGEVLAAVSYPEFSSQAMSDGDALKLLQYQKDTRMPFLDRVVRGLFTPGSIVKPFVAVGALEEGIITPEKQILSTGSISVPNPYNPDYPSIFLDWKAHGWVDMREALAVSSDVYFYAIGGGYKDQRGIGIINIDKYARLFGLGTTTGIALPGEQPGVIPTPQWKEENFSGEKWLLGDTYHTAIGQYGFSVTLVQMARAVAALANGGTLVTPVLEKGTPVATPQTLDIAQSTLQVVREGMRAGALHGTGNVFSSLPVSVASKTGTAELGVSKRSVNSWTTGFFPYENPRYAFAVLMEQGPRTNTVGASAAMKYVLEWMSLYTYEYVQ